MEEWLDFNTWEWWGEESSPFTKINVPDIPIEPNLGGKKSNIYF